MTQDIDDKEKKDKREVSVILGKIATAAAARRDLTAVSQATACALRAEAPEPLPGGVEAALGAWRARIERGWPGRSDEFLAMCVAAWPDVEDEPDSSRFSADHPAIDRERNQLARAYESEAGTIRLEREFVAGLGRHSRLADGAKPPDRLALLRAYAAAIARRAGWSPRVRRSVGAIVSDAIEEEAEAQALSQRRKAV